MGDEKDKEIEEVKENKEDQKAPEKETKKKPKSKSEEIQERGNKRILEGKESLIKNFKSKSNLMDCLEVLQEEKFVNKLISELAYLKYWGSYLNKIVNKGGLANISKNLFGSAKTLATFSKKYKDNKGEYETYSWPTVSNSCPVGVLDECDVDKFKKIDRDSYSDILHFVDRLCTAGNEVLEGLEKYQNTNDKKSYRMEGINVWKNFFKVFNDKLGLIQKSLVACIDAEKTINNTRKMIFGGTEDKKG